MDSDHLKNTREWIHQSVKNDNDAVLNVSTNDRSPYFLSPQEEDDHLDLLTKEELANPKQLAKAVSLRIPRYVPILKWIKSYNKQDAIGDILSAITVAIMLVPQGLAYAILAGLPPIYGLYSGWLPLVIYSFMGSCKQLAVGPEALLSVLLGSILAGFPDSEVVEVSHALAFLVGIISFLFGIFQFGFLGSIISRWVLSGFINAVALIIAISQLDAIIGVKFHGHMGPYEKFYFAITHIGDANVRTIVLSVCCVFFLFAMRFVKQGLVKKGFINAKYIPEIMLCVVGSILITFFFGLDEGEKGVLIVGPMDGGFPVPRFPRLQFDELQKLLPQAFLMVVVGFVEATAVSKSLATKHNYSISSNRELVAFGTCNILGSIFRCYPVFSSIPRTSIQDMAGSRTCLSGFLTSNILLFTCLFLTRLFTYLPICTMAAIIFVAAIGLLELHEVVFLWKTRSWYDLIQFMIALLSTFILEVELGILISVGMCIFLVLKHSSSPHVYSVLGRVPGTNRFKDVSKFPEAEPIEGILLVRVDEVLYFANIGQFKQLLSEIERMMDKAGSESGNGSVPLQSIIINVCNIPVVDASALLTLQEMVEAYHKRNVKVAFVQVSEKIKESFKKSGLYDIITPQFIFDSNFEAVTFLEQHIEAKLPENQSSVDGAPTKNHFEDDEDYNDQGAIISDGLRMDDYSDPDSDDFISK
ncbi:Sulfate transporter [Cavenderia fasciculata]|uniref:Sulfate transporter n=1 Tax=Cavenderia fasciculata TaxID=261658 RepID=F4PS58_CACFS|nr:Sulfate transporter [Cavenderia fasciculata]EGG21441.1 Sulfate transporter [Cavenderia fasciculata]|eukprot:XP_004359291.1 Sulfate transporter [Cavenderia fasciculata]